MGFTVIDCNANSVTRVRWFAEDVVWFVQDDNSPVSIFSYTGSNAQDARLAAARNGAKRLRIVRFSSVWW
jgi:4-aminobutyrate aminotransferase-like enzyme